MEAWRYYVTLVYFSGFSIAAFVFLQGTPEEKPTAFANRFLGVTTAKLLFSIVLLLIVIFAGAKAGRVMYVVTFTAMYLIFTGYLSSYAARIKRGSKVE